MFKNTLLSALILIAFSSFQNDAYSQMTVSKTINYSGFQACGGCTVCGDDYWCFNTAGSYCGNTTACGTQTFNDPIPPGNIVTDITATFYSAGCASGSMTATINNNSTIPVVYDDNSGCLCSSSPCSSAGSSTQNFPCGIQDYVYGSANSFELCTGSDVCVNSIDLVFTYVPENQATPATQPTAVTGPQLACVGDEVTYSIPPVANAVDYTWSTPPGWTINSGQGTTSITATSGDSGDICVIANNLCGSSTLTCLNVSVNSVDPSWTAPGALCLNDNSIDLSSQVTGLAGGDFSGDGISGNSFDPTTAGIGSHTITYDVTDSDGCSDTQNQDILVVNPPVFTLSYEDPTTCVSNDGYITISGLDPSVDYSISYDYGGNTVGPDDYTSDGNGEIVIPNLDGGSYGNFTVENASTSCSATESTVLTLVEPNSPTIDAGENQTVCDDIQVTLNGSGAGTGGTYSWNNNVSDGVAFTPGSGTTTYTVTGTDANGCESTDQVDVTLYQPPSVSAGNDIDVCDGESVVLTGSGATNYTWDNSVTDGVSFTPTSDETYTVTGTDGNGCVNTDQVNVTILSAIVPDFTGDELKGCEPHTVNFTNNTTESGAICTWSFGDGNTGTGCVSVSHTYSNSGVYDVSLTVETVDGCIGTKLEINYIEVVDSPVADFIADPMVIGVSNTEVEFTNQSMNSDSYIWGFGDESPNESTFDVVHTFPDNESGSYTVTLVAMDNQSNCPDTAEIVIEVEDQLIFYVPNTFTPDEDNYNQTFQPVFTAGFDPQDFDLFIFNRWGELIFESHDAAIGWDGTYGGKIVKDGTYIWKIEFQESMTDKRHFKQGSINLIR